MLNVDYRYRVSYRGGVWISDYDVLDASSLKQGVLVARLDSFRFRLACNPLSSMFDLLQDRFLMYGFRNYTVRSRCKVFILGISTLGQVQ